MCPMGGILTWLKRETKCTMSIYQIEFIWLLHIGQEQRNISIPFESHLLPVLHKLNRQCVKPVLIFHILWETLGGCLTDLKATQYMGIITTQAFLSSYLFCVTTLCSGLGMLSGSRWTITQHWMSMNPVWTPFLARMQWLPWVSMVAWQLVRAKKQNGITTCLLLLGKLYCFFWTEPSCPPPSPSLCIYVFTVQIQWYQSNLIIEISIQNQLSIFPLFTLSPWCLDECNLLCLGQILSGVILEVLGEEFPEVVTPEVAAAWTKLLATVYCGITAVYEEVGWTKISTSTGWSL